MKRYKKGDKFISERGKTLLLCCVHAEYREGDNGYCTYFTHCLICIDGEDIGNRWTEPFESEESSFTLDELKEVSKTINDFNPIS